MGSFTWIATILSMVLGLGVARLLTDFINAVRARHASRVSWVPLAWAGCIFLAQVQFWWAFGALASVHPAWTFAEFLGLVSFVMLLFASGAQLLPSTDPERDQGLRTFFARRGRWALVTLSVYLACSVLVNVAYFGANPLAPWLAIDLAIIALTMLVFFSRSERVQQIATGLAVAIYAVDLVLSSDTRLVTLIS